MLSSYAKIRAAVLALLGSMVGLSAAAGVLTDGPGDAEHAAAWPKAAAAAGLAGRAGVRCGVTADGRLHDCELLFEEPAGQGFGTALLGLASQYRADPSQGGGFVAFATSWPRPDTQATVAQGVPADQADLIATAGVRGKATLSCWATEGGAVEKCVTLEESAPGVGATAIRLAERLVMRPAMREGRAIASNVMIPVNIEAEPEFREVRAKCLVGSEGRYESCKVTDLAGFEPTVAEKLAGLFVSKACEVKAAPGTLVDEVMGLPANAFAQEQPLRSYTEPDWAERPTAAMMRRFYPTSREAKRSGGRATVDCTVTKAGQATNCEIVAETPPGLGFGAAAIAIAGELKFTPLLADCEPVDGGRIRLPFVFPSY